MSSSPALAVADSASLEVSSLSTNSWKSEGQQSAYMEETIKCPAVSEEYNFFHFIRALMVDKYTPTESSAPVHPTSERTLQSYLRPPRSTLSRPPSPSSPPPRGSAKRGLVEIIWKQLKNRQTLSSLSTALQIQRNISVATPHTSNIPSKIFRWFTCAIRMLIKDTHTDYY